MKILPRTSRFLLLLAGCCVCAASIQAETDAPFAQANQEYAQGNFKDAVRDYEGLVKAGQWSAALFYNLGNACFRTGDFGRAVLNYERAIALEPNHAEAQANLRVARDEARALELAPDWTSRVLRFATVNQLTAGAALFFWVGAFLCAASLLGQKRRRGMFILSIGSFILCLFLGLVVWSAESGQHGRSLAVVTAAGVQARLATADTAASVLALPAGSEVQVEQERGDWIYAVLPNNLQGWIPAKSIEPVRL